MRGMLPFALVAMMLAAAPVAVAQEDAIPATPSAAPQTTPAPADVQSPAAASLDPQPASGERQLTLSLADTPLARGPEFNAFPGAVAGWGPGPGWGPGGIGYGLLNPGTNPLPGLVAPIPLALKTALTFDLASEGKVQLRLFRVEDRTWDELDTWEKIGAVTSEVSAVAGIAMLVNELFH